MLFTHLAALVLGAALTLIILLFKKDGTLHINTSDPNKDVYSFEFLTPLNNIWQRKLIVFSVKVDDKKAQ